MKRSYSDSIKRGLEYIQLKGHIHIQEKGNGFHSQKITERQNGSAAINDSIGWTEPPQKYRKSNDLVQVCKIHTNDFSN